MPERFSIPLWMVLDSSVVKALIAGLTMLFYVEPALVGGVLICYVFNVIASVWRGFAEGEPFMRRLARACLTRMAVYLIALTMVVVISNMAPGLEVLPTMIFAAVASWEFLTTSAILSYIYEPWRPFHKRIGNILRGKIQALPEEDES